MDLSLQYFIKLWDKRYWSISHMGMRICPLATNDDKMSNYKKVALVTIISAKNSLRLNMIFYSIYIPYKWEWH